MSTFADLQTVIAAGIEAVQKLKDTGIGRGAEAGAASTEAVNELEDWAVQAGNYLPSSRMTLD